MSKIKEMLKSNYNKVVHSDISKLSAVEVMALRSIQENDPEKIRQLVALEQIYLNDGPRPNLDFDCPVVPISKKPKKNKDKK